MSFSKDNDAYEAWLAQHCDVVKKDIEYKHKRMTENPSSSCARHISAGQEQIGSWCPEVDGCAEGACGRRSASGEFRDLARCGRPPGLGRQRFRRSRRDALHARSGASCRQHPACAKTPSGRQRSAQRPTPCSKDIARASTTRKPALLFEGETWLRPHALPGEGEPEDFWAEVEEYPKAKPPPRIAQALIESLPEGVDKTAFACARAARAAAAWGGRVTSRSAIGAAGSVLREAKALVPSAWIWANGDKRSQKSNFLEVANGRYRAPDPLLARASQVHLPAHRGRCREDRARRRGRRRRSTSGCCRRWDSTSRRSMRRVRAALEAIKEDLEKRPRGWLNDAAATAAEQSQARFSGMEELTFIEVSDSAFVLRSRSARRFAAILSAEPVRQDHAIFSGCAAFG